MRVQSLESTLVGLYFLNFGLPLKVANERKLRGLNSFLNAVKIIRERVFEILVSLWVNQDCLNVCFELIKCWQNYWANNLRLVLMQTEK